MELEEPIKQMKVIHVAGTKGKVTKLTNEIIALVDFVDFMFSSEF